MNTGPPKSGGAAMTMSISNNANAAGSAVKILDLFCGGGGAAEGYLRAFPGAEIVGVDIADHSVNYPGEFVCGDALDLLRKFGHEFDLIHASPPCQGYSPHVSSVSSKWVPTRGKDEPRLIAEVWHALNIENDVPWVIENVMGARREMFSPTLLCGSMFGLPTARHRLFETSFPVDLMPHPPCKGIAKAYAAEKGWEYRDMTVTGKGRRKGTASRWKEILGITHTMTQAELAESIPPAYTEWVGRQFSRHHRTGLPNYGCVAGNAINEGHERLPSGVCQLCGDGP